MSTEKVVSMDRPEVGWRVRLKHQVDRFPEFSVPAASVGSQRGLRPPGPTEPGGSRTEAPGFAG